MNENYNVLSKIINLCIDYEIRNSKFALETLNLEINNCIKQILNLKDEKPIFFQRKKISEYNKKKEQLEKKLLNLYKEFENEMYDLELLINQ